MGEYVVARLSKPAFFVICEKDIPLPSMEIICLEQNKPIDFQKYSFAVRAETELQSHRRPSLFQSDFDQMNGVIYHLASPIAKEPGNAFIAYAFFEDEIRKHKQTEFIKFADAIKSELENFINELLKSSPIKKVLFTTDWQFGPERIFKSKEITIAQFWSLHNNGKLQFNASYPIKATD